MFLCHIGDFDRWVECDATVIDHLQNRWNQICKPNITLYLIPAVTGFSCNFFATELWPNLGQSCSSLMFQRFHAHFIRKCFFTWQHMLTLDIAVDHQNRGFVIVYVLHSGRDAFDAEFFTSLPPAMSAYHFIADTNLWSDDDGRNDAAL